MTEVNPELFRTLQSHDLPRAVREFFGTSNVRVVKAVGNFLLKAPGPFDHSSLRFLAAAAPLVDDMGYTTPAGRHYDMAPF